MMKASIILPAFNEEKNIGKVISSIKKAGDYEIIVVDDGSQDGTARIARKYGCICVSFGKNRGKGYACTAGAKIASNENIVFIDSDNQHNAEEIPKLLSALKENDMVIGKRTFSDIPIQRRLANSFARRVVSKVAGVPIKDALSGFRAVKRNKFFQLNLRNSRYEFESEMVIKAAKSNMKIKEVPVDVRYGSSSGMPMLESAKVAMFILTQLIKG